MPLSIHTTAIIEKNKLASKGIFIILLKVVNQETESYLCYHNENVVWNGVTWKCCDFSIGDLNETKESELPSVDLSIFDINRDLIPHLDLYASGNGTKVYRYIINTNLLNLTTPLKEDEFDIMEVKVDSMNKITFTLGAENLSTYRSPKNRFLKSHCRYKDFKGDECGYTGEEIDCNRSFTFCKEIGNQKRFGGQPGVGQTGIYK